MLGNKKCNSNKVKQTDLTQKKTASPKPLPISSVLCFPLAQPPFFFNCLIIHLQALIYPPSSALYAQPLCKTFSWIPNELVAYKVFLPGKAPIYGDVCLFFININPLGNECPYAVFFKSCPRNVLGREHKHLVWVLHKSLKIQNNSCCFSVETCDL